MQSRDCLRDFLLPVFQSNQGVFQQVGVDVGSSMKVRWRDMITDAWERSLRTTSCTVSSSASALAPLLCKNSVKEYVPCACHEPS